MKENLYEIAPLGDSALTVSFGNEISPELNENVILLDSVLRKAPFHGMIETVPAYSSLTVFYDARKVSSVYSDQTNSYEAVRSHVEALTQESKEVRRQKARRISIPVDFSSKVGLDLESLSEILDLQADEIIDIFTTTQYRVYFLGFIPGFAYMGDVDSRLKAPRQRVPRKSVPAGSVAIAGLQAGIYPSDSPGGWNIIGKTDVCLFDPLKDPPSLLQSGDEIVFFDKNS